MSTFVHQVASRLVVGLATALLLADAVHAQASGVRAISGRVIDEAGQAVPYATVLAQAGAQTTTRPDGSFRLPLTVAANVTLLVRQIGFHAESLTVALDAAVTALPDITVKLTRNPIQLNAVVVSALYSCSASDDGNAAARAELQPVFDALQENVHRTLTLLRAHPLRAEMALTFYDSTESKRSKDKKHKDKRTSEGTWLPYEPGNVIRQSVNGTMIVPVSMGFFVDSVFKSRHCFRYGGEETIDGRQALRIDFAPNSLVTGVDWAGSVFLDAKSYVFRAKRSSLTYAPNTRGKLQYMEWSTAYDEIFPGLVDMASDRRVRWTADESKPSDRIKMSVLETRTMKRTYTKDAPGPVGGEPTRR